MRASEQYRLINEFCKSAPVQVETLARALGVPVHYAFLEKELSGMIERSGEDYKITVNATDPETRKRFTIAHELGHYMLHRHLIGDGIFDDRAYRSTAAGKHRNRSIGPREETEANQFAVGVLMPRELIQQLQAEGVTSPEALARALGVSLQAMCIRLGVEYRRSQMEPIAIGD